MAVLKIGTLVDLIFLVTFTTLVLYYLQQGAKGKYRKVREIPGVSAIREGVGRAAEMGRPVHFTLGDRADIKTEYAPQVLAGIACLSEIARLCARTGTQLICTLGGSSGGGAEVLPLIEDVVYNAYVAEGKPEDYVREDIRCIAGERASWSAACIGIFYREKPATNIMIGPMAGFFLPVAAMASSLGMLQIGGTARTYHIPNMACLMDFFLVGEEIYAAGAILSQDPAMLATLTVEDIFKMFFIGIILLGSILLLGGSQWLKNILVI